MKSIEEIVQVTGGWERLRSRPLKLVVAGFMPLCLEIVGQGAARRLTAVDHALLRAERRRDA